MTGLLLCLVAMAFVARVGGVLPKVARPAEIVSRLKHMPTDMEREVRADFRSLAGDCAAVERDAQSAPDRAVTVLRRLRSEVAVLKADARADVREIADSFR